MSAYDCLCVFGLLVLAGETPWSAGVVVGIQQVSPGKGTGRHIACFILEP